MGLMLARSTRRSKRRKKKLRGLNLHGCHTIMIHCRFPTTPRHCASSHHKHSSCSSVPRNADLNTSTSIITPPSIMITLEKEKCAQNSVHTILVVIVQRAMLNGGQQECKQRSSLYGRHSSVKWVVERAVEFNLSSFWLGSGSVSRTADG
jgi:hypothetical protein